MAEITKQDILRTADQARLVLTDEEAQNYAVQLSEILTFTEKINEINMDDVKPTTNGNTIINVLRNDEPKQWDEKGAALENAPEHEDNHFKVPAIMD